MALNPVWSRSRLETTLSEREVWEWDVARLLYQVLVDGIKFAGQHVITNTEQAHIDEARNYYLRHYCNDCLHPGAFLRVERLLKRGIEACGVNLYNSELQSAKDWDKCVQAYERRLFANQAIAAIAHDHNAQVNAKVQAGLVSENYVSVTRSATQIECPSNSTISSLYDTVARGAENQETSLTADTKAYLLEHAPEATHTRDGLRWTPVKFDDTVSDLMENRNSLPPVIFVSRRGEHIVAVVGQRRRRATNIARAWDIASSVLRERRRDSGVILVPGPAPGRDLDLSIRDLAQLPESCRIHYMISDNSYARLGKWVRGQDPEMSDLSSYSVDNYIVIS